MGILSMTGLCHAGAVHPSIAVKADVFAVNVNRRFIAGRTGWAVLLGKLEGREFDIIHVGIINHKRIIT